MSIRAMHVALDFAPQEWSAGTRLVALLIANHVNDEDHAWPSIARLARTSGMSERAVQRHLRIIEAAGWIIRQPRMAGGRTVGNLWTWCAWPAGRGDTSVTGGVTPASPLHRGGGVTPASPRTVSTTNHQQNRKRGGHR